MTSYFYRFIGLFLGALTMNAYTAEPFSPTQDFADQFAAEWVEAWNGHDINRILAHYSEDFQMSSPLIVLRGIDSSGRLKGKDAVTAYWQPALAEGSMLHFELIQVLVSVNSLAIYYRSNASGGRFCIEVLRFNDEGKVMEGIAHYYPAL